MYVVANVIFPAFYAPYVTQFFFPVAPIVGLLIELWFYARWSKQAIGPRLAVMVLTANVLSSVVGMVVASHLPTGFVEEFAAAGRGPAHAPEWRSLVILAWIVAFAASVFIEWLVLASGRFFLRIPRPLLGSVFANTLSYMALLLIVVASLAVGGLKARAAQLTLAPDVNRCFTVLQGSHFIASRFTPVKLIRSAA